MKAILFSILLLPVCLSAQLRQQQPKAGIETNYLAEAKKRFVGPTAANRAFSVASSNFDTHFYRCEWEIDPAVRFISGKVTSYFSMTSASDKIVYDLSDTLTVDSIRYHSQLLSFQKIANDGLEIQFPSVIAAGQTDSVSIYYRGTPRSTGESVSFYAGTHSGTPVIYTLSEPYGGKEWWPCKNGLTDKADSMDIIISSPAAYRGTTNGVLVNEETTAGKKIVYFRHRYPIASYLVGIAVTNYVVDTDSVQINGKTMPVIMNAYPEFSDYFKNATFYAKQSIVKFSELFGEYPFIKEHYSQTQWDISGGMEHQTNSFIGRINNQLVAHELGHHWFGDKVTCGSWQHIWLNEGFADYMEFIYVENFQNEIRQGHLKAHMDLALQDSSGSVFVTDTTYSSRIFDNTLTYRKGGYVVHMLRGILGDSLFFKGVRQYLSDPSVKYGFAKTADLQRNLEAVADRSLQSFFNKWIYGQGYPNYSIVWYQNNNNWASIQLSQTTTHKSVSFYEMPVRLRFKNTLRDTVITVDHQYSGQIFWINPGFKADSMFIDPELWIMAKERTVKKIEAPTTITDYIKIYPNPSPDVLYISIQNPQPEKISIAMYTATGQLVWHSDLNPEGRDELLAINTSRFPHGTYILRLLKNNTCIITKKIVH